MCHARVSSQHLSIIKWWDEPFILSRSTSLGTFVALVPTAGSNFFFRVQILICQPVITNQMQLKTFSWKMSCFCSPICCNASFSQLITVTNLPNDYDLWSTFQLWYLWTWWLSQFTKKKLKKTLASLSTSDFYSWSNYPILRYSTKKRGGVAQKEKPRWAGNG